MLSGASRHFVQFLTRYFKPSQQEEEEEEDDEEEEEGEEGQVCLQHTEVKLRLEHLELSYLVYLVSGDVAAAARHE